MRPPTKLIETTDKNSIGNVGTMLAVKSTVMHWGLQLWHTTRIGHRAKVGAREGCFCDKNGLFKMNYTLEYDALSEWSRHMDRGSSVTSQAGNQRTYRLQIWCRYDDYCVMGCRFERIKVVDFRLWVVAKSSKHVNYLINDQ